MRDVAHFVWRCIETTIRPTWDTATTVGVITTVILAVVLITNPEKQQSITIGVAKITVLAIAIVFLARLVASPYAVYRSRDSEIAHRDATITEQSKRIEELEQNNELGKLLKQQVESSKKGSLSNRTAILAAEILDVVNQYQKNNDQTNAEQRDKMMSATDNEAREKAWNEMTQKYIDAFRDFDTMFNRRFTARITAIADELRSNGLTDPKLEKWLERPNTAAPTFTLTEVSVALSQLALKMEDIEKGTGTPTPSPTK